MICIASAGQAPSGEGERHHCQGSGRDTKIKTIERAYGTTLLVKSTACTYMGNTYCLVISDNCLSLNNEHA
jgi:hypothetical protein